MDTATRAKEAFKSGLALALAYGIALASGWMNPYWAAFAVAMIILPTAGQSISKGLLRLGGTIPGCIGGLAILSLAPQSRWGFMLLASAWIFFTTYMMLRSQKRSYFWNVAGFVCLIITLAGPASSENAFEHAVFRTVETAMGIAVYTLVTVLLWPRTNAGAIRNAASGLVTTQRDLLQAGRDAMAGQDVEERWAKLHTSQVQQLGKLAQALQAEGSENYEVHEVRHLWERFHGSSTALAGALDRWHAGLVDVRQIDLKAVLPEQESFFAELDGRLEEIEQVLGGSVPRHSAQAVSLDVDHDSLGRLAPLDRAALAVTRNELETLDTLSAAMWDCARVLAGGSASAHAPGSAARRAEKERAVGFPVPDRDHLMGATFAAASVVAAFVLWIFVNPPGHDGWFQFAGSLAMGIAAHQQLRATMLVTPIGVASVLALGVYVFVMPQLSSFVGLGLVIFLCMFIACFFFSGLARFAGIIAIINEISVQNEQAYNFAAMANSLLFTVIAFFFLFAMSYMIRSPRPEKAVLHLVSRFFTSAEYLLSRMAHGHESEPGLVERWKTAFHRHEVETLPGKLGAWGRAIDRGKFPGTSPEAVQGLVTSLQSLVYRLDDLLDSAEAPQAAAVVDELHDDIESWRGAIEASFGEWSTQPEARPGDGQREGLKAWVAGLETKIAEAAERARGNVTEEEGEAFYRLLGGYRGVSEAMAGYAGAARRVDWSEWREERF